MEFAERDKCGLYVIENTWVSGERGEKGWRIRRGIDGSPNVDEPCADVFEMCNSFGVGVGVSGNMQFYVTIRTLYGSKSNGLIARFAYEKSSEGVENW